MAAKLGLSYRTVSRLLNKLRTLVTLVKEDKKEGAYFSIAPEDRRQPLEGVRLSEDEMLALLVAGMAAQTALGETPLGDPLDRALNRIRKAEHHRFFTFDVEHQSALWHFDTIAVSVIEPEAFTALHQAMGEQQSVYIGYYSANSDRYDPERLIDPYLFAYQGSSWQVIGYCHTRRKVLDFALASIDKVIPASTHFSRQPTFDAEQHLRDRFHALAGTEAFVVRLWVAPDRAIFFRRKRYHPTQQIEHENPDGSLIVSFEAINIDDIRPFLQSWGVGITVLDSPELVARLREEARVLAKRYGPPP